MSDHNIVKIKIPKDSGDHNDIDLEDNRIFEKREDINNSRIKDHFINHEPLGDEPWNYKILLLLIKIGKKTMGFRWMHDQESLSNEKSDTKYSIIELILLALLGSITSGEFIGLVSESGLHNNKVAMVVITSMEIILILVYSIIKGIREKSDFDKNKFQHNYAATKFGEINLNIQNQLSLSIRDRDQDKDFLKNIIKTFNDLMLTVPKISAKVKATYIESTKENDIYNPIIIDSSNALQSFIDKTKSSEYSNGNANGNGNSNENGTVNGTVNGNNGSNSKDNIDSRYKYQIDRWLQHF